MIEWYLLSHLVFELTKPEEFPSFLLAKRQRAIIYLRAALHLVEGVCEKAGNIDQANLQRCLRPRLEEHIILTDPELFDGIVRGVNPDSREEVYLESAAALDYEARLSVVEIGFAAADFAGMIDHAWPELVNIATLYRIRRDDFARLGRAHLSRGRG